MTALSVTFIFKQALKQFLSDFCLGYHLLGQSPTMDYKIVENIRGGIWAGMCLGMREAIANFVYYADMDSVAWLPQDKRRVQTLLRLS